MEQNLDITERLTLKRPYYTLTSDDLSEAAAEIIELRRTVLRLEAQYGVQAKKAEDLEKKIAAIKEGYEGCCTACEPVALRNQELLKEVKDLTERHVHMSNIALGSRADVHQTRHDLDKANKERDEARRLACFLRAEIESTEPLIYCRKVAEEYKWDCFKDDSALGYDEEEESAHAVATAFATKIQEVEKEIVRLKEERDLARREVCRWEANHLSKTVTECARLNEWDCFKAERK